MHIKFKLRTVLLVSNSFFWRVATWRGFILFVSLDALFECGLLCIKVQIRTHIEHHISGRTLLQMLAIFTKTTHKLEADKLASLCKVITYVLHS